MKINVDKSAFKNGIYNERGLVQCTCGKHWYPSKKMIYDWLVKNYKDVAGEADIWSIGDYSDGVVTIHLELKYKVRDSK